MSALLLQLNIQRALKHLAHLDGLVLGGERQIVATLQRLRLVKQVIEVVLVLARAAEGCIVLILCLHLLELLGFLKLAPI